MKLGKIHCIKRLNTVNTTHAQSHHRSPALAIKLRMTHSNGMPIAAPTPRPLIISIKKSCLPMRLNPKRSSKWNCLYQEKGRSTIPEIIAIDPRRAICWVIPSPNNCEREMFKICRPPKRVKPIKIMALTPFSKTPNLNLAMV